MTEKNVVARIPGLRSTVVMVSWLGTTM